MAATACYFTISRVAEGDTTQEAVSFSNIGVTTAAFALKRGGKYCVDCIASTYGTVTLQRLGPDASTYLTALTAFSSNGTANADLPPGQYRVALA